MIKQNGIKLSMYKGTWYVISSAVITNSSKVLYLLESEQYGDEVGHVIINEDYTVLLDGVVNGFLDYLESFEEDVKLYVEQFRIFQIDEDEDFPIGRDFETVTDADRFITRNSHIKVQHGLYTQKYYYKRVYVELD